MHRGKITKNYLRAEKIIVFKNYFVLEVCIWIWILPILIIEQFLSMDPQCYRNIIFWTSERRVWVFVIATIMTQIFRNLSVWFVSWCAAPFGPHGIHYTLKHLHFIDKLLILLLISSSSFFINNFGFYHCMVLNHGKFYSNGTWK